MDVDAEHQQKSDMVFRYFMILQTDRVFRLKLSRFEVAVFQQVRQGKRISLDIAELLDTDLARVNIASKRMTELGYLRRNKIGGFRGKIYEYFCFYDDES